MYSDSSSKQKGKSKKRKAAPLFLHATDHHPAARHGNFDADFLPNPEYLASLPDMMHAKNAIRGANVAIHQVGISNFKLPLKFARKNGSPLTLEAAVTGTVSLAAHLKGINMSRIVRSFYEFADKSFTIDTLTKILRSYKKTISALDARLKVSFSYPIEQQSLRSSLSGFQFYSAEFQASLNAQNEVRRFVNFDFVYSSACPCSAELAEHARETRHVYAIPHSQRSKARIKIELSKGKSLGLEELQIKCADALKTETQVMAKREDEQAFAELNGAHMKFVEDASRLLFETLDGDSRIKDFEIACVHFESLHSHDAVAVICKGVPQGFKGDFMDFGDLLC